MVFPLAPNSSRRSSFQISITAVNTAEMHICRAKQPASVFSAEAWSPLPMNIDARGAPPEPIRAANAEMIRISGIQTPTPVRARLPASGICPI